MTDMCKVEDGVFGRRLVLTGRWHPSLLKVVQRERIVELEANYAHGWAGGELDFLYGLPHLEAFEVIDWNIKDVSPVHGLSKLRRLQVSTSCKTAIEFSSFPQLEDVSLEWRARAKSMFACKTLKRVFINRFAGASLSPLLGLPLLESLSVASPSISKIGSAPDRPPPLEFLGIYNARKLASLEGLQALRSLARLELNDCGKVGDINALAALTSLRILHLCDDGDVASLHPLRGVPGLRELLFYGSTAIRDGGIEFLLSLGLEKVVFQDRRHYDAKRAAFPAG